MIRFFFLALFLFLGVACSTIDPKDTCQGEHPSEAPDHSVSPLTDKQASEIASKTISRREHWQDRVDSHNNFHTVVYESCRINKGRWMVIAHRSVIEGGTKGSGNFGFDGQSPGQATVIVNKDGTILRYSTKPISP